MHIYMSVENQENYEELTPEQIQQQKEELIEFYKSSIESLQIQLEYEKLVTEIEETRLQRIIAQARIGQILAPAPEISEDDEPAPKKTLKRS
jgi:hypothetical protein